jgi:peptidyl-dipeptidase A
MSTRYAKESKSHKGTTLDEKRKLYLLLNGLTLPSPKDPKKNAEMTRLLSELESAYGSGKACNDQGKCRDLEELE